MQGIEKTPERPARQRLTGAAALVFGERSQTALAGNPLAFVVKDHRVAVEGDAQLVVPMLRSLGRQQGCGRYPCGQRTAHVFAMR